MDDKRLASIKPKFYMFKFLITGGSGDPVCATMLGILVTILIYGTIFFVAILFEKGFQPWAIPVIGIAILVVICIWLLFAFICGIFAKLNYNATHYDIYSDRIEFVEGFVNHKHTTINFYDVKEVHLTEGFIQRQFNLGSIKLVTAANTGVNTGISLNDIENSNVIYKKIRLLVERHKQQA